VQYWILLAILVFAEMFVFATLPPALLRGSVPLNPLGWFGYSELLAVNVDRRVYPVAYWMIVLVLALAVLLLGVFIYELWAHSMAIAVP
jgi:hypothetical protein